MADRPIEGHHEPVMAGLVVELLITKVEGAYLDLTAGGGGHLKALAGKLGSKARLYAADADPEAVARVSRELADLVQWRAVVQTAFADIGDALVEFEDRTFDGILIDLGVSSFQLDEPSRGISFRYDGPLDMRFNPGAGQPASELINSLGVSDLRELIAEYGEERQAARIAREIVKERQSQMILTTSQLRDIILAAVAPPHQTKSLARVFQALRIAVNRELEQLRRVLPVALSLLNPGGRLAVIAYHSLEDRQVKRFMQREARGNCTCPPELPQCVCGAKPTIRLITRRPVVPDDDEIARNPRARSARLRVAERLV